MYNLLPNTGFIGKNIIYLPTCHSTNDEAARLLAAQHIPEGTIVITSHQTAGRGQRGNSWESQPNLNLTFSLILRPAFLPATEQFTLNMAIALGIHEFLYSKITDNSLKIKWSNDLYYKTMKLGGILIENTVKKYNLETTIAGIGLNINQTGFGENRAISLQTITGAAFDLEFLLIELCESLEKYYLLLQKNGRKRLEARYLEHLYQFNEWHPYQTEEGTAFAGKITGIDESGRLCMDDTAGNKLAFGFKEVVFL